LKITYSEKVVKLTQQPDDYWTVMGRYRTVFSYIQTSYGEI